MKTQTKYSLLAVLTICIWGTTFVSTKLLLQQLSPVQIMFARYLIAYAALWAIYPRAHRPESLRQELACLGAALCGSTLYFLTENYALVHTQASNVSLLVSAAPILTALLAHLFTRDEKFTRHRLYGFLSAFFGIFLVVCNGHFVLRLSPTGDLLALSAALCWAFYTVLLRVVKSSHPPVFVTRKIFFYSLLTMLPFLPLDAKPLTATLLRDPRIWGNLLFLGLVASALCYVLWYHVVGALGAVRANNFVYLNPAVTMLASVAVLHERITGLMLVGAGFILFGVMLADGSLFRKAAPSPQTLP